MAADADAGVASAGTPAGFEIEGKRYSIPPIDTLTLQEERILYLYADAVIRDFIPPHPKAPEEEQRSFEVYQARKIRDPNFKRALAYISYRRENPDIDDGDILKAIDQVNAFELDLALLRGDDDSPPAQNSQSEQQPQSEINEPTSSTASGSPSNGTSARVVEIHGRTGTPESDTSNPGAVPSGLAS